MELFYIILISFLDWFRGQGKPKGTGAIKKALLGAAMGTAMGFTGWELLLASILCGASFANGWGAALGTALRKDGSPMGPKYENYWQSEFVNKLTKGKVRSSPLFALAFRGFWSFLFLLPLVYFNSSVVIMLPILMLSFSLTTLVTDHWKKYEMIRGSFIGAGCLLVTMI